ncbi:MAG: leucine-rich repeat domain-containing protein [Oscillospiraceae bacterium]|nr:leucine-rich repeat domain-containing protein [Oscillospiraceae bacterium]
MSIDSSANLGVFSSFEVSENNPVYSSIDGVLFNKDKTVLVKYPGQNTRSVYAIPSGVTSIGTRAFKNNAFLSNIIIPNTVTEIGAAAFANCHALTGVVIPDGITTIRTHTFHGCPSLGYVFIPKSVNEIDVGNFEAYGRIVIHCIEGSYAHNYAVENDIEYGF